MRFRHDGGFLRNWDARRWADSQPSSGAAVVRAGVLSRVSLVGIFRKEQEQQGDYGGIIDQKAAAAFIRVLEHFNVDRQKGSQMIDDAAVLLKVAASLARMFAK